MVNSVAIHTLSLKIIGVQKLMIMYVLHVGRLGWVRIGRQKKPNIIRKIINRRIELGNIAVPRINDN